jgi:hypothetical protein
MEAENIKQALREVLEEKSKEFWIDRETHYKHHEWLTCIITWSDHCKSTALQTVVRCIVYGLIGLVIFGFIFWGSKNFKGG